ncbi:bifunctional acetate--CoA ligase family protein/GNAT family N-acetyltransferase [Cellulomonas aerilata]|uniref:GNAT family N-acetyltransferase n=1 Tax=Cellulomonas aerilata TaxID=515326 RepID=A0A512DB30_9CELL|nr:GNAT family N-acetyltransferase [Cellulomonas aerilata]GEO33691.1 GNAT family N-acetyltransferase [Cellulomonas aerilata]
MAGPTDPRPEPAPYPEGWEADVVLRDGGTAHIRPITPADAPALQAFHVAQSEHSIYLRFFAALERLPDRDLARFTQVDHVDRVALIAVQSAHAEHLDPGSAEPGEPREPEEAGRPGRLDTADPGEPAEVIIGVARYDRITADEAEVAFNVSDAHSGRGLGSVLLEHLAAAAREVGVRRFTADVLPQNGRMIAVFREAGYEVRQTVDDGVVTVVFDIDPTDRSLAVTADREHRAEARSMQRLLGARSVLLVGAARAPEDSALDLVVKRAFASLSRSGTRELHVVGLPETHGHGHLPLQEWWSQPGSAPGEPTLVERWERLADVPRTIELAVVALPPRDVVSVVRRLGPLGVRSVIVLSTGFAETGEGGLVLQRELVRAAHSAGMRLVGPASYGLFDAAAQPPFNASLTEELPPPGSLGLFCQSAPMSVPILASVANRRLGVSSFVSAGHRADVSGNDLMQFWEEDPATEVVGLFLESIGNPRKFSRIARRLATAKPVVVVTAGKSGQVVPPGHAVRATRSPRRTLEEVFRQSGVVRAANTHEMLDVAQLFASQPLPAGRRVGIIAGASSMAALVAEAAAAAQLDHRGRVVWFGDDTPEEDLRASVRDLYRGGECDAVVVVHVPTVGTASPRVVRAVADAAAGSAVTTVACVLGLHGITDALTATDDEGRRWTVPAYSTPEGAVTALGAVVRYATWRSTDRGRPVTPAGIDRNRARRLIQGHLAAAVSGNGPVRLLPADAAELLGCYGVRLWPSRTVAGPDEAVAAAQELGWPVAVKSTASRLRHRADLGGVRLDIDGPDELRSDIAQLQERAAHLGAPYAPLEVQRMAPSGVACVVRTTEDPLFGPVVSFGLAGDATELLGDIGYGIPPLTDVDIAEMVRSVRAAPRLFGYRGLPPADIDALEDVIARLSVMASDHAELRVLELHPVVVAEHGAAVLSARIDLASARRTDTSRRSLPT